MALNPPILRTTIHLTTRSPRSWRTCHFQTGLVHPESNLFRVSALAPPEVPTFKDHSNKSLHLARSTVSYIFLCCVDSNEIVQKQASFLVYFKWIHGIFSITANQTAYTYTKSRQVQVIVLLRGWGLQSGYFNFSLVCILKQFNESLSDLGRASFDSDFL